jgi:hypothetical protein
MRTTRAIKNKEIFEFPKNDREFNDLLDYIRRQDFPIHQVRGENPVFFRKADLMLWRPQNLYLFAAKRGPRKLISQHDIFHPAIHHLLVSKFGHKLHGRPQLTLLCEAIATAAEFYFMLQNINREGIRKTEQMNFQEYVKGHMELENKSAALSRRAVQHAIKRSINEPFKSFQKAVFEGFAFYQDAFELACRRHKTFDFKALQRLCRPGKYGFIFSRYMWSVNVNYCLAYCGSTSSVEDKKLVKRCLNLLVDSSDFSEFLDLLGLSLQSQAA